MKFGSLAFAGILLQFFCLPISYAQSSSDSLSLTESLAAIYQLYVHEIGDNAQIYHGDEFIRNGQQAVGFPFFETDSMQTGSIFYQGFHHLNIRLYFNLVSGEIIIHNYANNALISLSQLKADSFTIGIHLFVRIQTGISNGLTQDGYYEKLYSGEPGLVVKREKRLVSGTGSEEAKYVQYDTYYIRIHHTYYRIEGKNDMLELFSNRQDEIKKYISIHKLKFKKDLEYSLLSATSYYSSLKQ